MGLSDGLELYFNPLPNRDVLCKTVTYEPSIS